MPKLCLLILTELLFLFRGSVLRAQTIEQTLNLAAIKSANAEYSESITLYNRVLFFDPTVLRAEIYLAMAQCYFELEDFKNASKYFDLAYFSEKNDSIRKEVIFKKASALLLMNEYKPCISELYNINDNETSYFIQKKNFHLAIAHFGLQEFASAETYFLNSLDSSNAQARHEIRGHFEKLKKIRNNRSKTAKIMSAVIPGAGQFYCGDIGNGVNSLLLNATFITLGMVIARTYTPFDAVMAVFPWLQRYYSGGIKKAEMIADQKTYNQKNRAYHSILDIIAASTK